MRRTIALFTAMAMMVLLAASVALAAVISCPNDSGGICRGTSSADTMTGSDAIYNTGDWGAGGEVIHGLGGNDTLNARGASDRLIGGPGNDKLDGGEQGDVYLFEDGWGVDTITADASGIDELNFSQLTRPVVVDLIADPSRDEAKSGTLLINTLNLASTGLIENVWGGAGSDIISGTDGNTFSSTSGSNYFYGAGGSDKLYGRGGSDSLSGGPMDDALSGGAGKDELHGDSGNDTINAVDNGTDGRITCGDGIDTVSYDRGFDAVPGSDCEKTTAYPIAAL